MVILLFKWSHELLGKSLKICKQAFQRTLITFLAAYIFKVSWLFTFLKSAGFFTFSNELKQFKGMWRCKSKSWQRSKIWLNDRTKLSCALKEKKAKNWCEYFSDCAQFTLYESHTCFVHHLYNSHSQHQKRSIWQHQNCQNCPKNYLQFMAHQRRNMRRHRLRFCVSYFLSILSDFL